MGDRDVPGVWPVQGPPDQRSLVPFSYIDWLIGWDGLRPHQYDEVREEWLRRWALIEQRKAMLWNAVLSAGDDVKTARPRRVHGIALSGAEAARLKEAQRTGELVVTPDLPVAANETLLEAWRLDCFHKKRPHRVREITWDDIEAEIQRSLESPTDP
jgi:hypothetical protein